MTRVLVGGMARMIVGAASAVAATSWFDATALAQQPLPPADAAPPPATDPSAPTAPATSPAPSAPPAPVTQPPVVATPVASPQPASSGAASADSDFDVEARRWAIGYAGISQVPFALGNAGAGASITVPAIGIRYWISDKVGLELALGLEWSGGSTMAAGMSTDKDSVFGFVVQGGVPIALATHRHVSFQLMPYFAYAHGSTSTGAGFTKTDLSGQRVDIGARVGFELFFGFIGIPELALSATVGMQFESLKFSATSQGLTSSDTTNGFSTTVQNNPWDIFAGNVAARYYF